ncbi:acetyl/propionyl/methylcrotonyl-CoA carboxylase subunit alpha [Streptomyces oceani]|uniref:biotin carboxylase n=1 Tax=Streptomyces oceani TaxID=1075402 RepID=A0A1E7KHK2_9ACTN|nr:biotin carboxylase N-terminal domain-containing protein [Streptomyces oceani]OEV03363.1 acetyl-/propionyl-CoA carboxylase subunit alpha [Streptomyces oceani]
MHKVLIADHGESALRVARACRDAGIASVAVYADPDRDTPHVRAGDEGFALGGDSPDTTYLNISKMLVAAKATGADAVHPGHGLLSQSADFAQAVLGEGLTWIGPSPRVIRALGDRATARRVARCAGGPLIAGTSDPVAGPEEAVAFAKEHGPPIVIKPAAGDGCGPKVAHTLEEVPELYDSVAGEAVAAFGRGECFVERYLDRPRYVQTQCLADQHGNVVVVSTRDCSLRRRDQKLVEEAPAPFLTTEQNARMYAVSKAILKEVGYVGAGTVEFLVGVDGTISFLDIHTCLPAEHAVSEEVTRLDLVREMFRLADGEELGYGDPNPLGHSIAFRVTSADPGRNFLLTPGTVTSVVAPSGPGVRLDTSVESGSVIDPGWDPLVANLIVTGATREQALQRAARALVECTVAGVATAIPFHRAVVKDPAFAPELTGSSEPFRVHTRWIETEFGNDIPAFGPPFRAVGAKGEPDRERVVVEVGGRRLEVSLPSSLGVRTTRAAAVGGARPKRPRHKTPGVSLFGDTLTSPMQGLVIRVAVEEGQDVKEGDLVVVLEAMKMEQPLNAHRAGTIKGLTVEVGASLTSGGVICEIKD